MVIDHAGYLFADKVDYMTWRALGRLCWPLIAWIVALRLYSAPHRVSGYLRRLIPWAIIAQVPYTFVFSLSKVPPEPWYSQFNILFTIAIGCMIFNMMQAWSKSGPLHRAGLAFGITILTILGTKTDYGSVGAVTIPVLAILAQQSLRWSAIGSGLMGLLANLMILLTDGIFLKYWPLALAPLGSSVIALFCLQNYIPLYRLPRWFFYMFYPVHLILLVILRLVMFPPENL